MPLSDLPNSTGSNDTLSAKTINYQGSTYTGVDIEVVVNLYTAPDISAQTKNIQNQIDVANNVASAATNLAVDDVSQFAFINSFTDSALAQRAGLDPGNPQEKQALDIVSNAFANTIFGLANAPVELKASAIAADMSRLADIYSKMAQDQSNTLANLQKQNALTSNSFKLGTLQTLSFQSFREKTRVGALGTSYPKGYTRGPRTIAGSMIFTVFNENALASLIRAMAKDATLYGENDAALSQLIADQLPPVDLTILFTNEYGSVSSMQLYGVEFFTDGMTLSVEDLLTEEIVQYVARDFDPMVDRGYVSLDQSNRGMNFSPGGKVQDASSLLIGTAETYNAYLSKLAVRRQGSY